MTDRQKIKSFRTDRLSGMQSARYLTVRDVLDLPVLQGVESLVLTGREGLSQKVRWVHVAESPPAPRLLEGGELVLTTGAGWGSVQEFTRAIQEMRVAGVVGFIIELGSRYSEVPTPVIEFCRRSGVPLIALKREVSFVAITEAAHRRIVGSQLMALEARDAVQEIFSELNRVGSSVEHIMAEVANLLKSPVVLEDLAGRIVYCHPFDQREADILRAWAEPERVIGAPSADESPANWREVQIAARGRRWGRLIVVDSELHVAEPIAGLIMDQASLALSLGAMASLVDRSESWDGLRQRRTIQKLVGRSYSDPADATALLEAVGIPSHTSIVMGVGWTVDRRHITAQHASVLMEKSRAVAQRIADKSRWRIVSTDFPEQPGAVLGVLACPTVVEVDLAVNKFAAEFRRECPRIDLFAVGHPVERYGGKNVTESLAEAQSLLQAAPARTAGVLRRFGREMEVLTDLVPGARLDEYVEQVLGALLAYDSKHHTDLQSALEAFLQNPTNRTRAANAAHLSRSVFYQRISQIESLLQRDLSDGHTIATLQLAVLARRRRAP